MATKKAHTHRPKAVEFRFTEKLPEAPPARRSRPVRDAPVATARLQLEELLNRHHGASEDEIRTLSPAAQKLLFRIVTDPADRDHVFRREAVSALAALGSPQAMMVLSALASDRDEDPVIIGRALRGLAARGGEVAVELVERSFERHPDPYVRTSAVKALRASRDPLAAEALARMTRAGKSRKDGKESKTGRAAAASRTTLRRERGR
jgi:hypothetical protein